MMWWMMMLYLSCACAPTQPHLVVVLIDDWGWANAGFIVNRPSLTRNETTPQMNALVKEGIQLSRHYVYSLCSPSRTSFQTGRLPFHVNTANYDAFDPSLGIPENMTTIAEKLTGVGYISHIVGKWDVGTATPRHLPTHRGYISSFHYFGHNNEPWQYIAPVPCNTTVYDLWENAAPSTLRGPSIASIMAASPNQSYPTIAQQQTYEELLFRQKLITVIADHDVSKPMFLVYSARMAHGSLQVPIYELDDWNFGNNDMFTCCNGMWNTPVPVVPVPNATNANEVTLAKLAKARCGCRARYAAGIDTVDAIIGNITQQLKDRNMWNNTLLLVTSDNGGAADAAANNYPLRSGKGFRISENKT
jgi:arylsulfatase B